MQQDSESLFFGAEIPAGAGEAAPSARDGPGDAGRTGHQRDHGVRRERRTDRLHPRSTRDRKGQTRRHPAVRVARECDGICIDATTGVPPSS